MNKRTELPTAENSSNFNRVAGATCQVGPTQQTLQAAVSGETGATAKKDMGRVMGELGRRTGGNFDKPAAAKEVGSRLA